MNFQNFTSIVTFFLHAPHDVTNGIESTIAYADLVDGEVMHAPVLIVVVHS